MKYLILILLFCSFFTLANRVEVSKRLSVTYENNGTPGAIVFDNQYMTNYIVRFIDKDGQSGNRLYIEPNNKKVNFDVADAEIVNYGLQINGKLPTFNSVETKKNIFNGFLAIDSDKKNYNIHITGGGLLGLLSIESTERSADFLSSERELDSDVKIAFFLNMLTMTELGAGIVDNVTFGKGTQEKVAVLKELVEIAQNTQQVAKNISFYYALSKAMVNQIETVAGYMGGMENGVLNNEILAHMLGRYKNAVDLIDKLVTVTDKLAGMQVGDEVVEDWEAKFKEESIKRLSEVRDIVVSDYQTAVAEEYSKLEGSEDSILDFVEQIVLVPSVAILDAYKNKLKLDYKAASGTAKEDLKLQVQIVTATKGLLQIYSLLMDSAELIKVIKEKPEEGKRIIGTMSYDIAESVAAYYLLDIDNIKDWGVDYILKNHGAEAASQANVYFKAFNASKDVANILLPFLSDFALSPARFKTSLIDGELSQLDPLQSQIQIINGSNTYTYDSMNSSENFDIFVDETSLIDFHLYLSRPDYFNEQKVPWKVNAGTPPLTIYDATVLVDRANAQRKTLCVKKVAYNEEFVFYDFDVDSAYTAFAGQCDAGEWGVVDGAWFDGDIAGPFDSFQLYDSDSDMSELTKLNNFAPPVISRRFAWSENKTQNNVVVNVNGYDLNNNHWVFNFYPKLAEDSFVFNISSDASYATRVTIENNFDSFSEKVESYSVDFGDGTGFSPLVGDFAGIIYAAPGKYTVKILIETTKGQELTVSRDITIEAPVSFSQETLLTNVDTTFSIEDLYSQISTVTWDFGDGTIIENSSLLSAEHSYSDEGNYQLVHTINTQDGRSFVQTTNLSVSSSSSVDLDRGLVAYYPFDGDASDQSGNANDGIENNSVTYTTGISGQAASFNGIDDFVKIESKLFGPKGTVSLWYFNDTTADEPLLGYLYDTDGSGLYYYNNRLGQSWVGFYNERESIYAPSSWQYSRWTNVTITYNLDEKSASIYVNGVKTQNIDTNNVQNLPDNTALFIGKRFRPAIGNEAFRGLIDEFRIYNRALNQDEINLLYAYP